MLKGNATLSPKATVTIEEPTKAANLLIFSSSVQGHQRLIAIVSSSYQLILGSKKGDLNDFIGATL